MSENLSLYNDVLARCIKITQMNHYKSVLSANLKPCQIAIEIPESPTDSPYLVFTDINGVYHKAGLIDHTQAINTIIGLDAALNSKQTIISGAATTIVDSNLTASKALVSDVNGKVAASAVTHTELNNLIGTTSSIQTQLNSALVTRFSLGTNYIAVRTPSRTAAQTNYEFWDSTAGWADLSCNTINAKGQTANRAVYLDANKKLVSATTTSTELEYLSGKNSVIDGAGTVNTVVKFTGDKRVGNSIITDNGTEVGIGASPSALTGKVLNVHSPLVSAFTAMGNLFDANDYDVAAFGRRTDGHLVSAIKLLTMSSASTFGARIAYLAPPVADGGCLRFDVGSNAGTNVLNLYNNGSANFKGALTVDSTTTLKNKLTINEEGIILNRSTGVPYIIWQDGAAANKWTMLRFSSGEEMRMHSNNNNGRFVVCKDYNSASILTVDTTNSRVGINEVAPTEALHIVGNILIRQDNSKIVLRDSTGNARAQIYPYSTADGLSINHASTGRLMHLQQNGTSKVIVENDGKTIISNDVKLGSKIIGTSTSGLIIQNDTIDGADTKMIGIQAGGDYAGGTARGGYIDMFGNEHATYPGMVRAVASSAVYVHPKLYMGTKPSNDASWNFALGKVFTFHESGVDESYITHNTYWSATPTSGWKYRETDGVGATVVALANGFSVSVAPSGTKDANTSFVEGMKILTDGNVRMMGNVGIGVTPTTYKLDVNGDVKIRGNLNFGSNYIYDGEIIFPNGNGVFDTLYVNSAEIGSIVSTNLTSTNATINSLLTANEISSNSAEIGTIEATYLTVTNAVGIGGLLTVNNNIKSIGLENKYVSTEIGWSNVVGSASPVVSTRYGWYDGFWDVGAYRSATTDIGDFAIRLNDAANYLTIGRTTGLVTVNILKSVGEIKGATIGNVLSDSNSVIFNTSVANFMGIKGAQDEQAGGIVFGILGDTNIYRSSANNLRTNDNFTTDGSLTVSGNTVLLNNATSNLISFNTAGAAAPTFTTRSAGTKIVLYPAVSGTGTDIAMGVQSNAFWFSTAYNIAGTGFKWYGGTTELMDLRGDGKLGIGCTAAYTLDVNGTGRVKQDLIVGDTSIASHRALSIVASDGYNATVQAYGAGQGTGVMYVGQSLSHGGGICYNGDGIPAYATGEGVDSISFFRRNNGVNEVVFDYTYSSSDVSFRGNIGIGTYADSTKRLKLYGNSGLDSMIMQNSNAENLSIEGHVGGNGTAARISTTGNTTTRPLIIGRDDLAMPTVISGALTVSGNTVTFNNTTSNLINFNCTNVASVAAPTLTNRSLGTRIILYPAISSNSLDYAVGIESGHVWHSVPNNTNATGFKWYGGTTQIMKLAGDGNLEIEGGILTNAITANTLDVYFASNLSTVNISGNLTFNNGIAPSNSSDGQGSTGTISYDANYIYLKTSSGWRRSALAAF